MDWIGTLAVIGSVIAGTVVATVGVVELRHEVARRTRIYLGT